LKNIIINCFYSIFKVVSTLAQQSGQIVLVNTAKHIASRFPRTGVSAGIPAAAEAAGSLIGIGIEGLSMGYDIYQKHKEVKEGRLQEIKFKKYIARRVTRGTMSVAGGMAGGIIGQMIIPVPVVGAVVGSLVGGIVGAVAGHGEGILIGELVEIIDNKIKNSKKSASKSNLLEIEGSKESLLKKITDSKDNLNDTSDTKSIKEKEPKKKEHDSEPSKGSFFKKLMGSKDNLKDTSDTKSINEKEQKQKGQELEASRPKYEVIDKLVFKFNPDVLKPGSLDHLKPEPAPLMPQLDVVSPDEINILSTDAAKVLTNAADLINDEDYEIYLLNDTNEIVQNLNVDTCLDPNSGSILKRKSLEAFSADQLPSDLNVFFKLDDNK
jgi:hypothetical protein